MKKYHLCMLSSVFPMAIALFLVKNQENTNIDFSLYIISMILLVSLTAILLYTGIEDLKKEIEIENKRKELELEELRRKEKQEDRERKLLQNKKVKTQPPLRR